MVRGQPRTSLTIALTACGAVALVYGIHIVLARSALLWWARAQARDAL